MNPSKKSATFQQSKLEKRLLKANNPANLEVLGRLLQPVTQSLFDNLNRINSPLLQIHEMVLQEFARDTARGDAEARIFARIKREIKSDLEDVYGAAFIFTTGQNQVKEMLDQGRESFRKAARDQFEGYHVVAVIQLLRVAVLHLIGCFSPPPPLNKRYSPSPN